MDTAIFISSTNFIMFTIVYNYYYFVNISKRYTAFQLFLSATLSVILSAIIIYLELISTDDFFKSASFPFPYEGKNSSSTVSFSSLARRKASASVGSYLLFSIAFTVCRETPHFFASSSCDSPRSFRLLLIIFSISIAVPFSVK